MAENDNPSIVNDASGNNYGGIGSGGSMSEANLAYLENLQRLAMKMPPKPLSNEQYMPGNQGIQRGVYNSPTTGSVSLMAPNNLIPFAMLAENKRSRAEEEAKYYAGLKKYLDKPLIDAKIKLNNPAAQPAFANKIQKVTDTMLAMHTDRQGGDPIMGRIALQNDPEYLRFIDSVSQYGDMYNTVNSLALDIVKKMLEPTKYYVSPDQKASVNKFLTTQDIFAKDSENTSFNGLVEATKEFQAKESIFALAEAATDGIEESIIEDFSRDPSIAMSTDKMNVWIKTKQTGSKQQAEDIYNDVVKFNDYDPEMNALLKKQIMGRIKYGIEKTTIQLEKNGAEEKLNLKKMGVDVQDDGNIKFESTHTALFDGVGYNAVNLPALTKPIMSITNMTGYTVIGGIMRHVAFDQAYPMMPKAEYDIGLGAHPQIKPDRYDEINMHLQSTEPYQVQRYYQMKGIPIPVGDPKGSIQPVPALLRDVVTGMTYDVMGDQTILVDHTQLDKTVESEYPGMLYVHKKLQEQAYPHSEKGNIPTGSKENPIKYLPGTDISKIKNDPNIWYINSNGKIATGAQLYNLVNKK